MFNAHITEFLHPSVQRKPAQQAPTYAYTSKKCQTSATLPRTIAVAPTCSSVVSQVLQPLGNYDEAQE